MICIHGANKAVWRSANGLQVIHITNVTYLIIIAESSVLN